MEDFLNKFMEDTKKISENPDFKHFINLLNQPTNQPVNQPVDENSLVERYTRNQKEKIQLEEEIGNLSEEERQNFWSSYYNIPTSDNKLEVLINSISSLNNNITSNFNIQEKFEELMCEIQILRKEIISKR